MKVVCLSGGVGGARLVDGLAAVLPPSDLTVIANTGDDFDHWGLRICPDLDTIMYTLAGLAHPDQGWGLASETWSAFAMMERLGGPAWFRLGDRDLATHLFRTERLHSSSLTDVTASLCRSLSISLSLLPMSDVPRPTLIDTPLGTLTFQDWLVRHRASPPVTAVRSANPAATTPAVLAAISAADLIIIGPSNPYVSIDPILTTTGIRPALSHKPIVAVSPIVAGRAIKGPLATMIPQLTGAAPSPTAIATHYASLLGRPLTGMVLETGDPPPRGIRTLATRTIIPTHHDRIALAEALMGTGSWV